MLRGNGETYAADVADEDGTRLGIIDVADVEGLAEIAENANGEAVGVNSDETNVVGVADRIEGFLLLIGETGCHDDLHLTEIYSRVRGTILNSLLLSPLHVESHSRTDSDRGASADTPVIESFQKYTLQHAVYQCPSQ